MRYEFGWFLGVADTNDVIQKIEKTLNNTHTTTQKLTNNSFRNTKKHPEFGGGLIFGGDYTGRGLFSEFYGSLNEEMTEKETGRERK